MEICFNSKSQPSREGATFSLKRIIEKTNPDITHPSLDARNILVIYVIEVIQEPPGQDSSTTLLRNIVISAVKSGFISQEGHFFL